MTCPSCGKSASGNFCQHCGAALGGQFCNKCGAKLQEGAKFCNKCGAGAGRGARPGAGGGGGAQRGGVKRGGAKKGGGKGGGGAPGPQHEPDRRTVAAEAVGGTNFAWWIAGLAMFGLILVVGWNMVQPGGPAEPAGGGTAAGSVDPNSPGTTDISQMSPREAADRLYNRVMSTLEAGDSAGGMGFQPMAVQAFDMAEPLDLDGIFHKAMLELLADPEAALASAQRILDQERNHILGLGVAAKAALAAGDTSAAEGYYRQLLESYDAEAGRPLVEYQGHTTSMQQFRIEADAFLSGG